MVTLDFLKIQANSPSSENLANGIDFKDNRSINISFMFSRSWIPVSAVRDLERFILPIQDLATTNRLHHQ